MFLAVSIGLRDPRGQRLLPGAAGAVDRGQLRPGLDPERAAATGGRGRGGRRRRLRLRRGPARLAGLGGPGHRRRRRGRVGPAGRGRPPGRGAGRPGPGRAPPAGPIGVDGLDPGPAVEPLVAAGHRRARSGSGAIRRIRNIDYWGDGNYRHKLDILHPPVGAARARPGPGLHPRRRLGDRGQAPTGHPDDARAGRSGAGCAWPSTTG